MTANYGRMGGTENENNGKIVLDSIRIMSGRNAPSRGHTQPKPTKSTPVVKSDQTRSDCGTRNRQKRKNRQSIHVQKCFRSSSSDTRLNHMHHHKHQIEGLFHPTHSHRRLTESELWDGNFSFSVPPALMYCSSSDLLSNSYL